MDGLESLKRMPLAEAVLTLWRHVADEGSLQQVFERYRGRCYEKVITFALVVHLISDALLEHHGSGNQSSAAPMKTMSCRYRVAPCTAS